MLRNSCPSAYIASISCDTSDVIGWHNRCTHSHDPNFVTVEPHPRGMFNNRMFIRSTYHNMSRVQHFTWHATILAAFKSSRNAWLSVLARQNRDVHKQVNSMFPLVSSRLEMARAASFWVLESQRTFSSAGFNIRGVARECAGHRSLLVRFWYFRWSQRQGSAYCKQRSNSMLRLAPISFARSPLAIAGTTPGILWCDTPVSLFLALDMHKGTQQCLPHDECYPYTKLKQITLHDIFLRTSTSANENFLADLPRMVVTSLCTTGTEGRGCFMLVSANSATSSMHWQMRKDDRKECDWTGEALLTGIVL